MAAVMLGIPFAPLDFKRLHRHTGASHKFTRYIRRHSVHTDSHMATPNALGNSYPPRNTATGNEPQDFEDLATAGEADRGHTGLDVTAVEDSSTRNGNTENDRRFLELSGHKRSVSSREASPSLDGEHPYRQHPSASGAVAQWTKQLSQKCETSAKTAHHLTQPNLRRHEIASSSLKTKTRSLQPKYYIVARPSKAYAEATPVIAKSLRHSRDSEMTGQAETARRPSLVSGLLAHRFTSSLQLHPPSHQHPPHSPPLSESGFSDHSLFSDHSSGSSDTTMSILTSSDDEYMHGHGNLKHVGMLSFQKPVSGQASSSKSYNVFVAPRLAKATTCPVGPYTIPISKYNRRSLSISTNVTGEPASGPMRTTRLSRSLREPDNKLQVPETPEPVSPPPFPRRPSLPTLVIPSRRSSAPAIAVKSDEAEPEVEYLSTMEEEEDDLDFCCRGSDSPLPARLAFSMNAEVPSELGLRRGKSLQALNLS